MEASAAATVSTSRAKDLADEITEKCRERYQVDVYGEQQKLDRHQDDDDILAVDEDAEDADREQDRGDGQIVRQADGHQRPLPDSTLRTSITCERLTCSAIDWRFTLGLWRRVSTMAPTMATSRTIPAAWKKKM